MIAQGAGLPPRLHNVISYAVSPAIFLAVGLFMRGPLVGPAYLLCAGMWFFHFLRRTLESAFLHVYTRSTVSVGDVLGEYVYYWVFSAWIAWGTSTAGHVLPGMPLRVLGISIFLIGELGNFTSHLMLRRLRRAGSLKRHIPHGFLFEYVSSPHYLFEILSWAGFAIVAQTWGSLAFLVVGSCILGSWARQRHLAYRVQFDGRKGELLYPNHRKCLVPFIY
jgi:very-long-chain enoyl-CoA reductase